jgi:hypothetical protein
MPLEMGAAVLNDIIHERLKDAVSFFMYVGYLSHSVQNFQRVETENG